MSITLKIAEITDPFAEDFGLVTSDVVLENSCTLREFLNAQYPGEDSAAYINCEKVNDDYELQDRNFLLIAFGTGKSKALSLIATIAVMVVAWQVAPAFASSDIGLSLGSALGASQAAVSMMAFSTINLIGNFLINALLAPDLPDADSSGFDKSKSYMWSGQSNKATQMIPIPVVLGTFRIAGNLINSYTHSFNVGKSGYAIQDTYYLLFGLTANELYSVDKCLINNMDANTFGESDRSVYYTLGTSDQHPLNTSSSSYLYPDDSTTQPESTGLLFPDLVEEIVLNQEIPLPNHYKVTIYETQSTAVKGQAKPNIYATLSNSLSSTDTTVSFNLGYDSDPVEPTGMMEISSASDDWESTKELIEYNNASCNGTACTANIIKRGITPTDFAQTANITFYGIKFEDKKVPVSSSFTNVAGEGEWQTGEYEVQKTFSLVNISNTDLDDIIIQIVFPQGLYQIAYGNKYNTRWVIFDFYVDRTGASSPRYLQMPIYSSSSFTEGHDELPKYWTDSITKKYSLNELWRTSQVVEFSVVDLLHDLDNSTWLTNQDDTNIQTLESGYSYTVGLRVRDYGYTSEFKGRHPLDENDHTDFTDITFSKVKGVKFDTSLNYPNVSTLGLVLNATPTTSGRLPLVQADVTGKFYVYTGSESKLEVSTWTRTATSNPAYLAINMMYNALWGAGIGGDESSSTKDIDFANKVNISKFIELADYCDEHIPLKDGDPETEWKPRYTFNGIYDVRTSFWKALQVVLNVANAVPIYDGNKISVYYEKAEPSVTQVFTSSNILEGSFSESFLGYGELAESISGNFLDKNNNYEKTSYIYMYPEGDPKKNQNIELVGIVEEERAVKKLQYKLNKTNTLKRVFKFTVADSSAIVSDVGSLIGIQSNFIDFGSAGSTVSISGRLTNIDLANAKVTLDKKLTTSYDSLLIKTLEGNLRTYSISFTDNSGDYTVYTLTPSTYLDECSNLDTYIVGNTNTLYKEATISSLSIHNDLSVDVEAICYDSSLFSGLYGFIINSQLSPELTESLCKTNNETAIYSCVNSDVTLHWTAPSGSTNYTDSNGDTQNPLFSVDRYLIYKKSSVSTYNKIAETSLLSYIDTDITFKETFSYKVVPVISYKGYTATIPLSWCTAFSVKITHQLFDYLEAPKWELTATANRDNNQLYDVNFIIENPGDWAFSSGLEGFVLFIRANDTDDTSEWFGPTDIKLTRAYTAGDPFIYVNKIDGLSMSLDGSVTLGLILVDDNDIIAVYSSEYTGSDYRLYIYTTDTTYQFSGGLDHSVGATVYNAHKGFFPSIAYSIGGWTTLFESESTVRVLNTNGAILGYDNATNKVTIIDELNDGTNFFPNDYIYLDGGTNTFSVITDLLADGVTVTGPISPYDFSINSVFHDVTGKQVAVYGITQESGIAGEGYQGQIKYDESGNIIATIVGYPVTYKYYWAAIMRVYFPKVQNKTNNAYGYVSVPKIKGI